MESSLGYTDYFPEITTALVGYDMQVGGAAYAAARHKERIVRSLAMQATAVSAGTSAGYASYDALDGQKNGTPTDAGWAATKTELNLRRIVWEADYAAGLFDPNVYAAGNLAFDANDRLIEQWDAIADREAGKILFAGLGIGAIGGTGAALAPIAAGYVGSQFVSGTAGTLAYYGTGATVGGVFGAGFEYSKNEVFGFAHTPGGYVGSVMGGAFGGTGFQILRGAGSAVSNTATGAFTGFISDFSGQLVDYSLGIGEDIDLNKIAISTISGGIGGTLFGDISFTRQGVNAGPNSTQSIFVGLRTKIATGSISQYRLRYAVTAGVVAGLESALPTGLSLHYSEALRKTQGQSR